MHVNDLTIPANTISNIPEEEYQITATLVSTFDAISRLVYQGLYIIDYNKHNFLHVSDNPLLLCGHTAQEVKEMGYMFYVNHVSEKDHAMLAEINAAGFNFFEKIPDKEKINYALSFDIHLVFGRRKTLVNHKFAPILLNNEGKIWLAACLVSLSSHTTQGNVVLRKTGYPFFWEYSLKNHQWEEKKEIILTEKEKDTLLLSAQGYSMNEIAEKLCVVLDTVRFYKKSIFEKLQVKNIVEAVSFASNYRLL